MLQSANSKFMDRAFANNRRKNQLPDSKNNDKMNNDRMNNDRMNHDRMLKIVSQ